MARPFRASDVSADTVLLSTFSHASALGFVIFDEQLRYRYINETLASANGVPLKLHIGRTIRDVMGETALRIEPLLQRVGRAQSPITFSAYGRIPGKEEIPYWVARCFPVKPTPGRAKTVATLVVDVTEVRKLARLLSNFRGDGLLVAEGKAAIEGYYSALSASIAHLANESLLDCRADEQLTPVVDHLDRRVELMRMFVSGVVDRLVETRAG